jgi:hypothetical protein
MRILMHWVLPIVLVAVGIAIFTRSILPQIPRQAGLRPLLGIVVLLFGVYRFVAARMPRSADRRRYGGEVQRPWEK